MIDIETRQAAAMQSIATSLNGTTVRLFASLVYDH